MTAYNATKLLLKTSAFQPSVPRRVYPQLFSNLDFEKSDIYKNIYLKYDLNKLYTYLKIKSNTVFVVVVCPLAKFFFSFFPSVFFFLVIVRNMSKVNKSRAS